MGGVMKKKRNNIRYGLILFVFLLLCIFTLYVIFEHKINLSHAKASRKWNNIEKEWKQPEKSWHHLTKRWEESARKSFCNRVQNWYRKKDGKMWCYLSPDQTTLLCSKRLCL